MHSAQTVDYDLHGLVAIRLLNASAGDRAVVADQVGPLMTSVANAPDIIIRFVDELPTPPSIRYIGGDRVGFTDDAFLRTPPGAHASGPNSSCGRMCTDIRSSMLSLRRLISLAGSGPPPGRFRIIQLTA